MVAVGIAAFLFVKPTPTLPVPALEKYITESRVAYFDYSSHSEKVTTLQLENVSFEDAAADVKSLERSGYTYMRREIPISGQFGKDIMDIASSKESLSGVTAELTMMRRRGEIYLMIREPIAAGSPELVFARKFRRTHVTQVVDGKVASVKTGAGKP